MKGIDYDDYKVTDEDDDFMVSIKDSLKTLTKTELKIFLTYCETGTYAETARLFNVSAPTVKSYIQMILDKLKQKIMI